MRAAVKLSLALVVGLASGRAYAADAVEEKTALVESVEFQDGRPIVREMILYGVRSDGSLAMDCLRMSLETGKPPSRYRIVFDRTKRLRAMWNLDERTVVLRPYTPNDSCRGLAQGYGDQMEDDDEWTRKRGPDANGITQIARFYPDYACSSLEETVTDEAGLPINMKTLVGEFDGVDPDTFDFNRAKSIGMLEQLERLEAQGGFARFDKAKLEELKKRAAFQDELNAEEIRRRLE